MGRGKNKSKRRDTDEHHFYHPRKLYKKKGIRNRIMKMSYDIHHNYHNFFMRNCQHGKGRDCNKGTCGFETFCCYKKTTTPWGELVVERGES